MEQHGHEGVQSPSSVETELKCDVFPKLSNERSAVFVIICLQLERAGPHSTCLRQTLIKK